MLPLVLCHQHLLSSQHLSREPTDVLNNPSELDSKLVSICWASKYFLASLLIEIAAKPSKDHPEKQFLLHHMCIPQATSVRLRTITAKTVLMKVPRGFSIVRFRRYFNASSSLCSFLITQILWSKNFLNVFSEIRLPSLRFSGSFSKVVSTFAFAEVNQFCRGTINKGKLYACAMGSVMLVYEDTVQMVTAIKLTDAYLCVWWALRPTLLDELYLPWSLISLLPQATQSFRGQSLAQVLGIGSNWCTLKGIFKI